MVNQIASGTGSQEQGKKSGDEGLQKLGQEAGSQAPSFSYKLDEKKVQEWLKNGIYSPTVDEFRKNMKKYILLKDGYKLPKVSGFRMARKV